MPADATRLIRLVLADAAPGAALECLELALAAARRVGARAIQDGQQLPPPEQLALGLKAAGEALEELAVDLAAGCDQGARGEVK